MKQRLGIAVSLLHKPSVLILDEPTNGLDPKGIRDLRHYLQRLAKEDGVTLLVSSHQLNEIEVLCDRAIVIKSGEVVDEIAMKEHESDVETLVNVRINAEPMSKAIEVLASYGMVSEKEGILELEKQPYNHVPKMVADLVHANVQVYGMSYQNKLEDTYFSLTEEKEVNAS